MLTAGQPLGESAKVTITGYSARWMLYLDIISESGTPAAENNWPSAAATIGVPAAAA